MILLRELHLFFQGNNIFFHRLSNEFLSGLIRVQTDAFEIIQFILSFIPDQISAGIDQIFIFSRKHSHSDPDEIEMTLRDCCKHILQQLCHDCHYKFRLQKENQKPSLPILMALRSSLDHLLDLLNYTQNTEKIHFINDLAFNIALYNGNDTMFKYLQHVFTRNTSVSDDMGKYFILENILASCSL